MADKKVVLVTGANTGLGYEIIKALYQSSVTYEIIVGTRGDAAKGEEAVKKLKSEVNSSTSSLSTITVDVASDESIAKASDELAGRYSKLDVLINNAGAAFDDSITKGTMTAREAWNAAWDINVTGTYLLTQALVPMLLKASDPRLFFITSGTAPLANTEDHSHHLSAAPPAGWPKPSGFTFTSYRSSKTGMNMMAREWDRILRNDGVKVFIVSPGFLATGLGGVGPDYLKKMGALEPHLGGQFVQKVVEGERDADVGKAINSQGIQPW